MNKSSNFNRPPPPWDFFHVRWKVRMRGGARNTARVRTLFLPPCVQRVWNLKKFLNVGIKAWWMSLSWSTGFPPSICRFHVFNSVWDPRVQREREESHARNRAARISMFWSSSLFSILYPKWELVSQVIDNEQLLSRPFFRCRWGPACGCFLGWRYPSAGREKLDDVDRRAAARM